MKLLHQALAFYEKYDRRIGLGFMALGFTIDSLTLTRIDRPFENIILVGYLTIALAAILMINSYRSEKKHTELYRKLHPWLFLPMQYAFGALFSGFVVLYFNSSSLITSWPFLLILLAMLVGNEFARKRYAQFVYHVTIFYTALFSFVIFLIPVLMKRMGAGIFILSGLISLLIIAAIVVLIRKLSPEPFMKHLGLVVISIAAVYLLFNLLYFTNIIPPIPLSLKSIGVYHQLEPVGVYRAKAETHAWYRWWNDTSLVFHRYDNEPVYVSSSIFAPTKLSTRIFHQWHFYDPASNVWVQKDRLFFSIVGGRGGGYRGYSRKQSVQPGKWRVDVVTDRNQLVGRVTFTIEEVDQPPVTSDVML